MTLATWFVYLAAVLVLTITPGPSVLMCVSTSINCGPRKGLIAALGSTSAIVGIMTLSALGLGAALAASELLFSLLKWLGAGYLAYLGVSLLLSKPTSIDLPRSNASSQTRLYMQGFLVGASNPKALLFFGALFPQFINPQAAQLPQFLLLGATFVFFELLWLSIYTLGAGKAKHWLQQPQHTHMLNRVTGGVFLLAGGLLANSRYNIAP